MNVATQAKPQPESEALSEVFEPSQAFLEAQARASLFQHNPALKRTLKTTFHRVQPGLEQVQARIIECFSSDAKQLVDISRYLLDLGGKRIRPVIALLSAELFSKEPISLELIDAASGIELIHMATLLHDDIIDQSPLRRNKQSALLKFGFTPTLLAGDFLWVRAFGLCAHLGEFIVRATEKACVELTEGEITEGQLSTSRNVSLDEYVSIISKKTGSLFWLSAAVGAYLGGASPQDVERLSEFGRAAGIVFQMVDDILDVVADETLLGKKSGTDLRQRTPSLVNILWLQSGSQNALRYFAAETVTEDEVTIAIEEILNTGIIPASRAQAEAFATRALASLASIEHNGLREEIRSELAAIIQFTLERCL